MPSPPAFDTLDPKLQISFFYRLRTIRNQFLVDGMRETVKKVDIVSLDQDLSALVPKTALQRVASFGLRGELFFPVPALLRQNPLLLGYYRLLFGFSQKEFYNKGPFGRFRRMEERGELPGRVAPLVGELCKSLIATAAEMVEKMDSLSVAAIHELQLLTLGPQWRGEENTRIGQQATTAVFDLIRRIVTPAIIAETRRSFNIRNAANRTVVVQFASDPDIEITETLPDSVRPVVSIEIKGGADASNVHNRLGEAEKSHQKARQRGFHEFWTIVRVEVPPRVVSAESPTTTRAFHLARILDDLSPEHRAFVDELNSRLGLRSQRRGRRSPRS